MNENQPYNDHNLHIEPCVCGNLEPEVSGDDFDGDVTCGKCGRNTGAYYGTKGAINAWNSGKIIQKEEDKTSKLLSVFFDYIDAKIDLKIDDGNSAGGTMSSSIREMEIKEELIKLVKELNL